MSTSVLLYISKFYLASCFSVFSLNSDRKFSFSNGVTNECSGQSTTNWSVLLNPVFTDEGIENCTIYSDDAFSCEVKLKKNMKDW